MTSTAFLKRLWQNMCAVYRDGALARACLEMQERYDADVPLLLVLCLADRAGHHIAASELSALVEDCRQWRDATVLPLRFARQEMKRRFTAPAQLGLRDDIKRLELEAERLQVLRLGDILPPASPAAGSAALAYLALRTTEPAAAEQFQTIFNHAYDEQVLCSLAMD
jgi:uncharacterized protein (TIGR02444 family)